MHCLIGSAHGPRGLSVYRGVKDYDPHSHTSDISNCICYPRWILQKGKFLKQDQLEKLDNSGGVLCCSVVASLLLYLDHSQTIHTNEACLEEVMISKLRYSTES